MNLNKMKHHQSDSTFMWFAGQEENSTSQVTPLLDEDKAIEKYLDSRHSAEEMTLDPLYYCERKIYTLCCCFQ